MRITLLIANALCALFWIVELTLFLLGSFEPSNFTIGALFFFTILMFVENVIDKLGGNHS